MNRAQPALESVQRQPADAVAMAEGLLARADLTDEERASAHWALGRAHAELDALDRATVAFDEALSIATVGGLTELAAEVRLSLSGARLSAGDTAGARDLLDESEPHLSAPASRGRLAMQRGLIDLHAGNLDHALGFFNEGEPLLREDRETLALMRLLVNRGVVHTMVADFENAERDLVEARALAQEAGQAIVAAGAAQNLGFIASKNGELPSALTWFDRARADYRSIGSPQRVVGLLESDRAAALLSGGLYAEATEAAERARSLAAASGNQMNEAEALLLSARGALAAGRHRDAEARAIDAAELFTQTDRAPWAALAEYIALQAAVDASDRPDEALLDRAALIADDLRIAGWRRESLEVSTFTGRIGLILGRVWEARAHLSAAAESRLDGSLLVKASGWLAAALLALADDDRLAAKAAADAGMELIEEYRSTLASTELRAHASINGADLGDLGLRLALEDADATEAFQWAERRHAGAMIAPADGAIVRRDGRIAEAIVELRRARAAALDGSIDPLDNDADDRAIAALEREIRDLTRQGSVDPGAAPQALTRPTIDHVRGVLGNRALVEYVSLDNALHAIVVTADRLMVVDLGPSADVELDVRKLCSGLVRAAASPVTRSLDSPIDERSRGPSDRLAAATAAAVEATAARLDQRLIQPLGLPEDGEVVLVPTAPCSSLPWSALPSLRGRPVTVAPSARVWLGTALPTPAASSGATPTRALLVAGPRLPGAVREIEQIQTLYDDPIVLTGDRASVESVLASMAEVDVVHIAAHGVFRADNPMFSSLELADGPLTVYDIERLPTAPSTVVLPACDAGRSSVRPGDELLGTAAALMQIGVGQIVAPVTIVPDSDVVTALMVALHRRVIDGDDASTSLVRARADQRVGRHGGQRSREEAGVVEPSLPPPSTLSAFSFLSIGRLSG